MNNDPQKRPDKVMKYIGSISKAAALAAGVFILITLVKLVPMFSNGTTKITVENEHFDSAIDSWESGRYLDAEAGFLTALEEVREQYGEDGLATAQVRQRLGALYNEMARYDDALEQLNSAYVTFREKLGDEDRISVITKAQIGIADAHTGNYEQGIRGLSDAYDNCTSIDLKSQIVLNIVQCRLEAGNYSEAAQEYGLLEDLYKQLYGDTAEGAGALAVLWNDKAALYDKMGDPVSAIDGYETALRYWMRSRDVTELSETVLSAEGDRELVNILINEATAAINAPGYTGAAQDLVDKALTVCRERFGEDNSETARCFHTIAGFYNAIQDKDSEKRCLDGALSICLSTLGENSDLAAAICGSLGQYYVFWGEPETAVSYYERAVDIRRNILGYNDLLTASLFESAAAAKNLMHDFEGAIEAGRTAAAICEGLVGEDSPQTADAYIELSRPLINTDQYAEAQELLDRSVAIYQKHLPDGSVNEAFAWQYQMKLYLRQGEYASALAAGKTSLALFQKFQGGSHSNTADASAFLGDVYVLLGDAANADALYSQAAAVYSGIFSPEAVHGAMDTRIRDVIALEQTGAADTLHQQAGERVSQMPETVTDEQIADRYASWGITF